MEPLTWVKRERFRIEYTGQINGVVHYDPMERYLLISENGFNHEDLLEWAERNSYNMTFIFGGYDKLLRVNF